MHARAHVIKCAHAYVRVSPLVVSNFIKIEAFVAEIFEYGIFGKLDIKTGKDDTSLNTQDTF